MWGTLEVFRVSLSAAKNYRRYRKCFAPDLRDLVGLTANAPNDELRLRSIKAQTGERLRRWSVGRSVKFTEWVNLASTGSGLFYAL
jgi:hypothetical protein